MITRKFKTSSLRELFCQWEERGNTTVDNLQFMEPVASYEFIFMDLKDFRLYRSFIDNKGEEVDCVEVRPQNKIVTTYVAVEEKPTRYDYNGPICLPT